MQRNFQQPMSARVMRVCAVCSERWDTAEDGVGDYRWVVCCKKKKKKKNSSHDTTSHGQKKKKQSKRKKTKTKENTGAGLQTREVLLHILMALPLRHGALTSPRQITLPFCTLPRAYTPSRCSCQRCRKDKSMPEAVLPRQQHGSWERTRRAQRPQPDGGDAHRAMLPDHARCPPQGRAARVRWPCGQRRAGHHHLRRYPPQACRRCADHHPPERGAGTRTAQGPARAESSRATGVDMAYCKQPLLPRHRP